jgi:hypothetical protein
MIYVYAVNYSKFPEIIYYIRRVKPVRPYNSRCVGRGVILLNFEIIQPPPPGHHNRLTRAILLNTEQKSNKTTAPFNVKPKLYKFRRANLICISFNATLSTSHLCSTSARMFVTFSKYLQDGMNKIDFHKFLRHRNTVHYFNIESVISFAFRQHQRTISVTYCKDTVSSCCGAAAIRQELNQAKSLLIHNCTAYNDSSLHKHKARLILVIKHNN